MSGLRHDVGLPGIGYLWLLCLLGAAYGAILHLAGRGGRFPDSAAGVNMHLFLTQDAAWLGLLVLLVPALAWTFGRSQLRLGGTHSRIVPPRRPVLWLALATLVLGAAGVELVFHGYALSLDEFMARFQAQILLRGRVLAPLAAEWADMAPALQPVFMRYDPSNGLWGPGYRPMAAALIALFELAHLGKYVNVVVAAACLPLLAALARRLWPAQPVAPALAVFILATSPQFLFTAMTPYAMTAHLFFSLLWLCCFLRGGTAGHIGAALTGFIAIGLHQVHIHPLFVLPFMLSLLAERRLRLAAAYALWYAAALAFWILWRDIATFAIASADGIRAIEGSTFFKRLFYYLSRHSIGELSIWLANFFRFLAWQNLMLVPLLVVAFRHWRQAPKPLRLLGWGIVLSLLPYLLFMPFQGHGWGYRYLHALLGSFALIGVFGWLKVAEALDERGRARARRILFGLAAASIFVGLPTRAVQIERFVAPYAASSAHIAGLPQEVVLVDSYDAWFALDLVRNDPLLERNPKVLEVHMLNSDQLQRLCHRRRVALVDHETLQRFGIAMTPREPEVRAAARRALRERLRNHGCLPS